MDSCMPVSGEPFAGAASLVLVDEFETAAVEVAHQDSGDVERVVLINLSGRVNKSTDRPTQMFSLLPEDALALIDGLMIALETIDKAQK